LKISDLKFYDAGSAIRVSPKQSYQNDFDEILDMGFSNAPNVFSDVQYEVTYGERDFTTATAIRVDAIFEPSTGQNKGDDFKRFIFPTTFPTPYIGQMFIWKNNYWLGINSDNYQSLGKSLGCRRCNNTLRWKDDYGNTITEPCVMM